MPWPDCAPSHSLPDGGGGNRPPSGQPNVPANSRQSGLRVPLAASSPRYLALTNIRRRSQSLTAATEDRHRPPSTPNRARTIALPCPYRPFRCCIVIPSVDLGLAVLVEVRARGFARGAEPPWRGVWGAAPDTISRAGGRVNTDIVFDSKSVGMKHWRLSGAASHQASATVQPSVRRVRSPSGGRRPADRPRPRL